jgi:hypothetical protein
LKNAILTWCKGEAFSARLRFTAIYAIMKMLRPYEKKLFFNDYIKYLSELQVIIMVYCF